MNITKAAKAEKSAISADDIALINGYALKEMQENEIFVFKVALCDNQVDRDFEQFSDSALYKLAEFFKGKTVISDHIPKADNQCARIYKAEVISDGDVKRLVAHCYIPITEKTAELISEIESGIKKEVSVGCSVEKAICSICGTNNKESYCSHMAGREYDGKMCTFTLDGAKDAYEVSFVAVPAQKEAGVIKSYGAKPYDEKSVENAIGCDLQLIRVFLFTEKE